MSRFYDLTPCPDCHGTQLAEGTCVCGGSGSLPCSQCHGGIEPQAASCSRCNGTGLERCVFCQGRGKPLCMTCHGAGHLPPELVGQILRERQEALLHDPRRGPRE